MSLPLFPPLPKLLLLLRELLLLLLLRDLDEEPRPDRLEFARDEPRLCAIESSRLRRLDFAERRFASPPWRKLPPPRPARPIEAPAPCITLTGLPGTKSGGSPGRRY